MHVNSAKCLVPVAIAATVAVIFGGCASSGYNVQVDAISQATGMAAADPGKSYRIQPANPTEDTASLHYKEVAGFLRTALSSKGMYESPDPEKADVVVTVDYGMNQPRVKFQSIALPIIEDSGGQKVTQTINSVDPYTGLNSGPYQVTVDVPAERRVVGTEHKVKPTVVYEKYLNVSAHKNQPDGDGRSGAEVWSVNVSAEDESKELRRYLPVLAAATADYIGTNTHEEKDAKISEGDDNVAFIKKGM
ncbi:MAG TPA: hypothetical protein VL200_16130 [Lacunisphaera sp.]|jgi:hypothetical protein|nr:hypothetical protein [Lacunisphaera sp.]